MKNLLLIMIVVLTTYQLHGLTNSATFALQAQTFTGLSGAQNTAINKEASAQKDKKTEADFSNLKSLIVKKKDIGKTSRPKALSLQDRIKQFTASLLGQKKKTGQPLKLSSQEISNIQRRALLAQNQRG